MTLLRAALAKPAPHMCTGTSRASFMAAVIRRGNTTSALSASMPSTVSLAAHSTETMNFPDEVVSFG